MSDDDKWGEEYLRIFPRSRAAAEMSTSDDDDRAVEVERYRTALKQCEEDAVWHLRGESGLPFDRDTYACLRAVAETARDALRPPCTGDLDRHDDAPTDWADVHTCYAGCPCHTGGKPAPDFEDGTS